MLAGPQRPRVPVDRNGTAVVVGDRVRIVQLCGDWFDRLPAQERVNVASMVGDVFAIEEIDAYGQPWVRKSGVDGAQGICHGHSVALEPWEMELVGDAPPRLE